VASISIGSFAKGFRRVGKTILICGVPGCQVRPSLERLPAARRGKDSECRTQPVPIALCYNLQLAVFRLDLCQATWGSIDDQMRPLAGTDEIPLRA
jgi:hypothetical protein